MRICDNITRVTTARGEGNGNSTKHWDVSWKHKIIVKLHWLTENNDRL